MNSEQFTSLPHAGGVGNGNGNGNSRNYYNNRNYKKKGKRNNYKNNNNNNNNSNSVNNQHNNYHNQHSDFGCSSLPHTQNNYNNNRYNNQYQQFNKFTTNSSDLDSFGNNVPVPKSVKKQNKPRRGGNNNNYRSTGQFRNANGSERLNKSLNKDDVSFSELNTMMPTSYSLDNIGAINSSVPSSTSFHNNLPSKLNKLAEEISEIRNNIDSGVDSNSYCSMPTDGQKSYTPLTSDLLSSIEADELEEPASKTSSSVSSPSTNSPNQNGYETAISQMASEAENSFGGFDSVNVNNENTIVDVEIEALSYVNQIEQAVLEKYIHETNVIQNIDQAVGVSVNTETLVENLEDTTTSVSSDSFENDSAKKNPVDLLTGNIEKLSINVKEVEAIVEVEEVQGEVEKIIDAEKVQGEEALATNLMSSSSVQKEMSQSDADEKLLAQMKFAEQEVNDLVNKIVHDVITQAITVAPLPDFVESDSHNHMSLEQEINQVEDAQVKEENRCIDDLEISYIDNDNSVISSKEETDAASQSMEIIKGPEEPAIDTTNDILNKTEQVLSNSLPKNTLKNDIAVKEQPIDCFSCTIS